MTAGLDSLVRQTVSIVGAVTQSLQATVTHNAWVSNSSDGYVTPTFASTSYRAVVQWRQRRITTDTGRVVDQVAEVVFIQPIPANGATGRKEPIDPRDTMGRDAAILGMTLFNTSPAELASLHALIGAGLEQGTLRPVVSREMPLGEAVAAHHAVMESSTHGKIVLLP